MLFSAFVLLLLSKHYFNESFFTHLIVDEQFSLEKKFVAEQEEMHISNDEFNEAMESRTEEDLKNLKEAAEAIDNEEDLDDLEKFINDSEGIKPDYSDDYNDDNLNDYGDEITEILRQLDLEEKTSVF